MGYTRFNSRPQMAHVGAKALEALDGLGVSLVTNTDFCAKHGDKDNRYKSDCRCNTFWYVTRSGNTRYKQENSKVGDTFYDGNNGDKHEVLAVDLENSRLVFRNLDQNEDLIQIAVW